MEDKRISKAQSRRLEAEKKARNNRIIFTVICVIICIGVIALIAFLQDKNKDNKATDSKESASLTGVTDKSHAYSAGLTADGKIAGVDNIDDYVQLNEISMVVYKDDYIEEKTPTGEVKVDIESQIGAHLIDMYVFYADVQVYSGYYEAMYDLYEFIYNDQYEAYSSAYEDNNMGGWKTLYDFLGVSESEYYDIVEEKATSEARYYLTVQALVDRFGITCTSQDKMDYCMSADNSIVNEAGVNDTIKKYGDAYITQRTLEWKLKYRLAEEAEILDGKITDKISDKSEIFSANYYENGKIKGIGKLENYITASDYEQYVAQCTSAEELLQMVIDNSEIKVFDDYVYTKSQELQQTMTLPETNEDEVGSLDYDLLAEEAFKRDVTVQYLATEFGIDVLDYEKSFCSENLLDPDNKAKYVFEYGEGYYNRKIMEYAVLSSLDELMQE